MIEIIPAILPENIGELRMKVGMVKDYVRTVQFDICDGRFVPSKTWPYNGKDVLAHQKILAEEEGLPFWQEVNYEFDLMIQQATDSFQQILMLGPTRIVFHIEAEKDLKTFFENLDSYHKQTIEFGIAIKTTTDPALLEPLYPYIQFVQCMGIERPGFQAEPFDERVLEQIHSIRVRMPELPISVDGSVNKGTAHALIEAGATRLVIGSALFDTLDIQGTLEDFQHLIV